MKWNSPKFETENLFFFKRKIIDPTCTGLEIMPFLQSGTAKKCVGMDFFLYN